MLFNPYDQLKSWLDSLVSEERNDVIRAFLGAENIQRLFGRDISFVSSGDFLGVVIQRDEKDNLEKYLLEKFPNRFNSSIKLGINPSLPKRVPFTNRDKEISEIVLGNTVPTRTFLISAPAGFGKTDLMTKLNEKFEQKGWQCALIRVMRETSASEMTTSLAEKLNLSLISDSKASVAWGKRLSSAWKIEFQRASVEEDKKLPGLVLLIDFQGEPSFELLKYLLEHFIPDFQTNLRTLVPFSTGDTCLHFIIAGRSLQNLNLLNRPAIRALSPFDYTVVRDTTRAYLTKDTEQTIDQIAAHVLHMTGGHPGCMAHALQYYHQQSLHPDDFLELCEEDIWEGAVRSAVQRFEKELVENNFYLRDIFEALSVFRYLDNAALQRMIDIHKPTDIRDAHDLVRKLTATYLYSKKGSYLKDAICRKLFLLRLRYANQQRLIELCQDALIICEDRIKFSPRPEKWIIEYLFQTIQLASCFDIENQESRTQIRNNFMNIQINTAIKALTSRKQSSDETRDNIEDLLDNISDDEHWEFRFAVNYYLRDNQYTNQPYEELKKRLSDIADSMF